MDLQNGIHFFGHLLELLVQLLRLLLEGHELLNCDVLVRRVDLPVNLLLWPPQILVGHVFAGTSFEGRRMILERIIGLLNLFEAILRIHLVALILRFLHLFTLTALLLRRVILLRRYSAIIGSLLLRRLAFCFLAGFFCQVNIYVQLVEERQIDRCKRRYHVFLSVTLAYELIISLCELTDLEF